MIDFFWVIAPELSKYDEFNSNFWSLVPSLLESESGSCAFLLILNHSLKHASGFYFDYLEELVNFLSDLLLSDNPIQQCAIETSQNFV